MSGAQLDPRLVELVSRDFVAGAARHFGVASQGIVTALLSMVTAFLDRVDPTSLSGRLIIAYRPNSDDAAASDLSKVEPTHRFASVMDVPSSLTDEALIDVLPSGNLKVYAGQPLTPVAASQGGIAYDYQAGVERVYVNGEEYLVPNPIGAPSVFTKSTFGSLEAALRQYRLRFVRYSTCYLFQDVWADSKRLFLKNRPEAVMRRSLTNFLRGYLDAEVMPEQNVDETHPIDIKVTFPLTNRRALIEIKWMGVSHTASGGLLRYRPARANEGAGQLARYLDWIQSNAPQFSHRGYLIVIDARRQGLNQGVTSITHQQAFYYERRSVKYDPAVLARADFAHPRRLFATAIAP